MMQTSQPDLTVAYMLVRQILRDGKQLAAHIEIGVQIGIDRVAERDGIGKPLKFKRHK